MTRFSRLILFSAFLGTLTALAPSMSNAQSETTTELVEKSDVWRKVQAIAKDTVVQIFVYTAHFNWFEPYKSPSQRRAAGSGFFIDDQGHIVSNYHVVDDAVSIKIQIPSLGLERFDVKIIGVSPERDVALLKLTDKSLTQLRKKLGQISYLKLGNSDVVVRTQAILSLGYPLAQEKLKSTQGIVSGRERIRRESYIQVTAALNEGISGGPSLDSSGNVIGINTAGIPAAQNIGYIIPINDVKTVLKRLYKEKFARRPFLGVEVNYGTEALRKHLGNPKPGGVYINRVYEGTPFDRFGIKEGDMLYRFNGLDFDMFGQTQVDWSEDKVSIPDLVNRLDVGQDIEVIIYRNGERKVFKSKLKLPELLPIRKMYPDFEKIDFEIIGGLVVMSLRLNHVMAMLEKKPKFIKYSELKNRYEPRLIVTHIFPNSAAQRARTVVAGDLLEEVNGLKVSTLEEFRKAIRATENGFVSVKTEDKRFMVLSVDEIVNEEVPLSQLYYFKPSELLEALKKSQE